jgi:hypothetical protein
MAKEKWRERQKQWIQSLGIRVWLYCLLSVGRFEGLRAAWMMVGLFGGVLRKCSRGWNSKRPKF